jgi:hypothetical protein
MPEEVPWTHVRYRVVSMTDDGALHLKQVDETPNSAPREVDLAGLEFLIGFEDGKPVPFVCRASPPPA